LHACPQTKHRYEYLAANDTHRDQCHTQYQTNPPRHGFLGGSSQELAAACAASADLAAQRRGSPGRTPSSRSCPRAAAEAPVPCTRRHSSKERRKKLAPGPRAASARSAGVNGMPPWRLPIFEVISRTVHGPTLHQDERRIAPPGSAPTGERPSHFICALMSGSTVRVVDHSAAIMLCNSL